MKEYSKVSIRTVNAFLRKKGIDPMEFGVQTKKNELRLGRKEVNALKNLLVAEKRAIVYMKGSKIVIRDAGAKLFFEDPKNQRAAIEIAQKKRAQKQRQEEPEEALV